jgi:hypothetical protein
VVVSRRHRRTWIAAAAEWVNAEARDVAAVRAALRNLRQQLDRLLREVLLCVALAGLAWQILRQALGL